MTIVIEREDGTVERSVFNVKSVSASDTGKQYKLSMEFADTPIMVPKNRVLKVKLS